jgi:hypothetical protein
MEVDRALPGELTLDELREALINDAERPLT